MSRIMGHVGRGVDAADRQTVVVSATLSPTTVRAVQMSGWLPKVPGDGHFVLPIVDPLEGRERAGAGAGGEGGEEGGALPDTLRHAFLVAPPSRACDVASRALRALGSRRALVFMNRR